MNTLDYIMDHFTDRQLVIYRKREIEKKTFSQIGKEIGLSGGRVAQLFQLALFKRDYYKLNSDSKYLEAII